jgi:alkaline phosphatase D
MHHAHSPHRRQLLSWGVAAAASPVFLPHALAQEVPRFALGVASGHPQPDGMVLWTRLSGPDLPPLVDVRWELADDEAFTRIVARGTELALAGLAHSVHAEPRGLAPGRAYWYRFTALGQRSMTGRTRTAPAPDAVATLRYVIASCQRWDVGHFAAWNHVVRDAPELVLFLGDYLYEYATGKDAVRSVEGGQVRTLAQYRARYAQYKGDPALQAAHACAPWLVIWDDHEVENDYAGTTGQTLQPDFAAQRDAAYQAWWEHMPVPKAWLPRAGHDMLVYERHTWGRLATIHALDARQYRDVQVCPRPGRAGSTTVNLKDCPDLLLPQRTMLGLEQERWLAEGWDAQRHWNLLAQQTLMARFSWAEVPDKARYWTDGWDGYGPARERLLATVAQRKLRNVVVLGGDVHTHYVADLKADFQDPRSPVLASEFCGSSITSLSLPQERIDAGLKHNSHLHYGRGDQRGYMRFDLSEKRLEAQVMALHDARDPDSSITTAARFVVEPGRPGPQRA